MDEHYNDIDTLIAKFLAGEATPDEAMHLQDWVNQSNANRKIMEDAEAAWALHTQSYVMPDARQVSDSLQQIITAKHVLFTPLRIAASVFILLCSATILYLSLRTDRHENPWIVKESTNQSYSLQLPEKTSVTLNKNTKLRYPQIFESSRTVTLNGEAYFDVTPNPEKPFIISTDALEIKVLGTAFNVSAYPADTLIWVQVVHGKVSVKHLTDSIELGAGQKGLYHKITQKLSIEKAESHNNIAYATHMFTYTDGSLGQILDDLSAAYGVTFHVENVRVKECHLTGEYYTMPLSVILEIISKSLDLTYSIKGNEVYISGDGCL